MRLVFLLFIVLIGCSNPKPNLATYYDLDSLLDSQIDLLKSRHLRIEKTIVKDGESETQTIEMDSLAWGDEFRLLRDFNPANPKYVEAFEVSKDGNTIVYTLLDGRPGSLQRFEMNDSGDTLTIQGDFYEDKTIYTQKRTMKMQIADGLLTGIDLTLSQIRYPSDSLSLSVKTRVSY